MRLRKLCLVAAAGVAAILLGAPARADLLITVDKSAQQMTVSVDGERRYVWPVSTGGAGYDTPSGDWKPFRMEKDHFSKEWDDAPMPNSIFFTMEGHAIHGTFDAKNLGKPVSHGCVRLSRANSEVLWNLVKQQKMANTKVVLTGEIPGGGAPAVARRQPRPEADQDDDRNAYYAVDPDDGYTASVPPRRVVRSYREAPPPRYYYGGQPYVERRYYRAGSNNAPFPFGW